MLVWVGEKWQIIVCEAGIQDLHCYNLGIVGWGGNEKEGNGQCRQKTVEMKRGWLDILLIRAHYSQFYK